MEGVQETMTNTELGDNLIALGTLLKDDNATIQQVTAAALKCGLTFRFAVVPETYDDPDKENTE